METRKNLLDLPERRHHRRPTPARRGLIAPVSAFVVLCLAACQLPSPTPPLQDPAVAALQSRLQANGSMPLPFKVAIAFPTLVPPVTIAVEGEDIAPANGEDLAAGAPISTLAPATTTTPAAAAVTTQVAESGSTTSTTEAAAGTATTDGEEPDRQPDGAAHDALAQAAAPAPEEPEPAGAAPGGHAATTTLTYTASSSAATVADASQAAEEKTDATPDDPSEQAEDKVVRTLPLDALAHQKELTEMLGALGLFRSVERLRPIENAADAADEQKLLLQAAREIDADLLLVPRVLRNDVSYVGMTGWWVPSWVTGLLAWWPTFFFPDEEWAATVRLSWDVYFVRSEKRIWPGQSPVKRASASFNDFQRGWDLPGPYGIPLLPNNGWFGVEDRNMRAVGETLLPVATAQAETALLLELGSFLEKTPIRPDPSLTRPETYAIVIGVNGPAKKTGVPSLCCAERDAVAIAARLADDRTGIADAKNLATLTGTDATREAVQELLEVLTAKLSSQDRVVFYFAGYGATDAAGAGYLVLSDTDPERLAETALPLAALLGGDETDATDGGPDGRPGGLVEQRPSATIVLDTSFDGEGGRTLPRGGSAARPLDLEALERSAKLRRSAFLLTASSPGESALEYEPEGHGLLTLVLMRGLEDGDEDEDGKVSLGEAVRWTEARLPPAASVVGGVQTPMLYCQVRSDADRRVLAHPGGKDAPAESPTAAPTQAPSEAPTLPPADKEEPPAKDEEAAAPTSSSSP